ncbi:MAG: methyltransferase domain-containing protein [Tardiphaga sp.]
MTTTPDDPADGTAEIAPGATRPGDGAIVLPDVAAAQAQVERWTIDFPAFGGLLARHGHPVPALRQFGALGRRSGDFQQAAAAFMAALALAPREVWLWRDLAGVYQTSSRHDLAAACVRRALALDATHAATWLQYAVLAEQLGDDAEAEHGFRRALALDPDLADAHFALGLLYMKALRFEEAVASLHQAVLRGDADAVVYLSLGHALYMAAKFSDSADAFARAAGFAPLSGHSLQKYARATTFAAMIAGDVGQALARYPALAGDAREPLDDITRDGFALFSAYGYREAAIAVGRLRLAQNPDDPIQRHLNDAVAGKPLDGVPGAYTEAYFDAFAEGFEDKLVGRLDYRAPRDLAELVGRHGSSFSHMLDLGCGTGLAGNYLARFGPELTGVDLSANMLRRAARRPAYRTVVKSEANEFLAGRPASFDLVFASDVLIYFGRLDGLMAAVAQALVRGGIFAASIELAKQGDFEILPSGRFAHAKAYFASLAAPWFDILEQTEGALRLEAGVPVRGGLFVVRRR